MGGSSSPLGQRRDRVLFLIFFLRFPIFSFQGTKLVMQAGVRRPEDLRKEGYTMTVVDFIDVINDIIDLSSDEETVQEEHIATQPRGTLLDRQAVFVIADEGRQAAQAASVPVGEGSQEATESEDALVATASPSVMERAPLDTAESKNCPSFPTTAPLRSLTSTTLKALTSEVGDTQLVTTASPLVMERADGSFLKSRFLPSKSYLVYMRRGLTSTTPKALTSEVGDAQLITTTPPSVKKKAPLYTTESNKCPSSPASAPLPSRTSTTPNALNSEVGDRQLVTTALPSVMEKTPLGTAESNTCPSSPASAPFPSLTSTTPKALAPEVGDRKLVRVKYPKKNYHTSTPRRSPRLRECCNNPMEELAADHKRSRIGIVVALPAMQKLQTPSLLHECCNNSVEELEDDHKRSRIGIVVALPAMQNLQTPSLLTPQTKGTTVVALVCLIGIYGITIIAF